MVAKTKTPATIASPHVRGVPGGRRRATSCVTPTQINRITTEVTKATTRRAPLLVNAVTYYPGGPVPAPARSTTPPLMVRHRSVRSQAGPAGLPGRGAGHLDSSAMTDVPEHLLRRSRERREALGLGGGGAPPTAPEEEPAQAAAPTEAAAEVAEPAEVGTDVAEAPAATAATAPARPGARPATITVEPAVYALPETP